MSKGTGGIDTIPEESLWAELVRRTQERERNGEASFWPRVTLDMVMDGSGAAARLDALDASDPESAHDAADAILLESVPTEVRTAYERLVGRCSWWATA